MSWKTRSGLTKFLNRTCANIRINGYGFTADGKPGPKANHRSIELPDGLTVDHGLQPRDAVFDWRMRAEQINDTASAQRIHDEHVSRGRIRIERYSLRSQVELSKRVRQP